MYCITLSVLNFATIVLVKGTEKQELFAIKIQYNFPGLAENVIDLQSRIYFVLGV